jgi:hypothetical protein
MGPCIRVYINFQPNVVEIFLRYLYNGTLPLTTSLSWDDMIGMLKISDKYNAKDLFDSIDSHISQGFLMLLNLNVFDNDQKHIKIEHYLKELEGIQAPKLTVMIYKWRSTEKGSNCLDDNKWSSLIRKNPNFAMLGGIIFGRNDYQDWFLQHRSWFLTGKNDFAVLVGPIGKIKGAVKCSPI